MNEASGEVGVRRPWRKPPRLYEDIANDLADAISRDQYAPNAFLPTEMVLAEEYSASRNVIREALKLLSARGMVEVLHGRGTRVLPRHRWHVTDQLVRLVREDPQVPQNLLELRHILEVEIAGLAALRAQADHIRAMQETIDRIREATGDPEDSIEPDLRFHQLLVEATNNPLLILIFDPINDLLRAGRLATVHNPGGAGPTIVAHSAILERVAAHDVTGAREAMRRHLEQVEEDLGQIVRESEARPSPLVEALGR